MCVHTEHQELLLNHHGDLVSPKKARHERGVVLVNHQATLGRQALLLERLEQVSRHFRHLFLAVVVVIVIMIVVVVVEKHRWATNKQHRKNGDGGKTRRRGGGLRFSCFCSHDLRTTDCTEGATIFDNYLGSQGVKKRPQKVLNNTQRSDLGTTCAGFETEFLTAQEESGHGLLRAEPEKKTSNTPLPRDQRVPEHLDGSK